MGLLGQEKLILGHNKTNYGTEKGDFLGQEKLILGHNEASCGSNYVDAFIMRQIMGQNKVTSWDRRS